MEAFRDQVIQCIQFADSKKLASLLSVRKTENALVLSKAKGDVSKLFQRLPDPWIALVDSFIKCLPPYLNSNWKQLFDNYKEMFNCFLRIFQTGDASMLELLFVMCDELWYFARQVTPIWLYYFYL